MITLFTDTNTDITPEIAAKYDYHVISMPYRLQDTEVYPYQTEGYKTFNETDSKCFYDKLRSGIVPTTAGISPQAYYDYFEPYFKNGDEILYVHFSKAMSSTFSAMSLAIKELSQKYPKGRFYTIDTKAISTLSLMIVEQVGKMYKQKKTIAQMIRWARHEVDHYSVYFYADNVKFFQKSGRVSGLAGTMANVLKIHPIINMDRSGQMTVCKKAHGRIKSLHTIIDFMKKNGDRVSKFPIIIGHSDNLRFAQKLQKMILDEFGEQTKVTIHSINPTAGAHCGPDVVGVAFHSKIR